MDLKQLEYIIEISNEKNISRAAKKLYITQSALNQQLLKLEKEIGSQLFLRSRTSCKLTPVGQIYIESAKKILEIKKEAYNKIYDYLNDYKGEISIGLLADRGIYLFVSILDELKKKYPNLTIKPLDLSVVKQQEMLINNKLDLGFMTLGDNQKSEDNYVPIYRERFVLVCSKKNIFIDKLELNTVEEVDLSKLKDMEFVVIEKGTVTREMTDKKFKEFKINPKILFETSYSRSIVTAVKSSNCCFAILPFYYAASNLDELEVYEMKNPILWEVSISYKKGKYLNEPAKYFIELSKKFWEGENLKLNKLYEIYKTKSRNSY
ncbi:LysR substrate-binding domain-containing protein [Fusobacterium sp. MFO224]|uniref:LysR family transcriptional regulator n=1 Tax=Fusobacterium sp. MFO224 TaxID=3378070 RepID=UPI00385404C3